MLKDTNEDIIINGEPNEVTEIRKKILSEFNDLIFIEDGHKYFLNGMQLPSVSEVTHKFSNPFDEDKIAENYARKNGETAQYWKDKWHYNSLMSTKKGTLVHAYGESLGWLRNGHPEKITEENKCKYIEDKGWLIPTRKKEEAVLKFYDELHPSLHFVLAETKVYSNKGDASNVSTPFCGTFDILFYYKDEKDDSKSGLCIFDFKTNKELENEFSRSHNKMLLPPFNDMYDESLSLYTLQLSLYALCLRGIGLNIIANRIVWLKDSGDYEIVPLRDLSKDNTFKTLI